MAHGCYDRVICMRKHSRIVRRIDAIRCVFSKSPVTELDGEKSVSHILNFPRWLSRPVLVVGVCVTGMSGKALDGICMFVL